MNRLAFADTETTGLAADLHEVWEYGFVVREPGRPDVRHRYLVRPQHLDTADPAALAVGGFKERTAGVEISLVGAVANLADPSLPPAWSDPATLAARLEDLLDGAVLVGSNPTFDKSFLVPFLAKHDRELTCHYRVVDVGTLAWGHLNGRAHVDRWLARVLGLGRGARRRHALLAAGLPWSSTDLAREFGIVRENAHEALADAEFARDVYDRVTGSRPVIEPWEVS